jgi:putative Ca2+/H+ antiporter (TMEM165/GDT1 family)
MEALLVSVAVSALAEIGDKTQILALILASQFKQPGTIIAAILLATLVNHSLAAALGTWVAIVMSVEALRWMLTLLFVALAGWTFLARAGDVEEMKLSRFGVFGATAIALFLAETGDKTQVATVALAARYGSPASVVIGTALGVLLADVPAVLIGCRVTHKVPVRLVQAAGGALLLLLGIATFMAGMAGPPG